MANNCKGVNGLMTEPARGWKVERRSRLVWSPGEIVNLWMRTLRPSTNRRAFDSNSMKWWNVKSHMLIMCVYYRDGLGKNLMIYWWYTCRGELVVTSHVVRIRCMYMLPSDEVLLELQLTYLGVVSIHMENASPWQSRCGTWARMMIDRHYSCIEH